MDYKVIVVSEDYAHMAAEKLEKQVKQEIHRGWKPLGGVSVSRSDFGSFGKVVLAQAMIKE